MRQPVVEGLAVDTPVEVEPVAGRLAALLAAAHLAAVADRKSVRSAGHPAAVAPPIWWPRDGLLHRRRRLLRRFSLSSGL